MQANERELAMALRGGVRGRFRHSFHLLENALEVLDDQMAHCVTPTEYETLRPLLAQITEQLAALQRLGEHAADAAIAPVLHQACAPRPMELLGQLRELSSLLNEILLQEQVRAAVQMRVAEGTQVLLTMGDDTLLNGLLANLVSNSLAAGQPVQITLACAPGLFCYQDDGPGLPPDARALLQEGRWSDRLLEQGGLGLPLIHAYASAMGWTLTVEDGPGTRLRFALPPCAMDLGGMLLESEADPSAARERRRRYLQCELHPVLADKPE
ncbi:HAMP domain-containing sensor histidine kinase [uncultured Subdoligranulum sp.]|uniref:sensor histidine kinase n=1 Tax=uncultured Subdoligranulum sp. TaxID=512298 RepID=UPI0025DE14D4|nr:ATP-binding protein [uncultured Subdoligranulum sp.]